MTGQKSGVLATAGLILLAAVGCTSERDRIAAALDRDLADALAGCVPVAWERNPELRAQWGMCGTGRWQNRLPYILEALSHMGWVRVAAEEPGALLFTRGKQYELAAGQPIATSSSKAGTTTVVCWADVRGHVVATGPVEVKDGHLSVNVWFELEATAPLRVERLGKRDREILRHHTYWTRHLEWIDERTYWMRPHSIMRTATYRNGDWSFPSLLQRGTVTRSVSKRRIIWGAPQPAASRPRIARVDRQANRYRLFVNGFEEGDLSAWKSTGSRAGKTNP